MVTLLLTDRQAEKLARVVDDPPVAAAIAEQLRFNRLFKDVEDTPVTVVLRRQPNDRLAYAAASFGSTEAATRAFDRLWKRAVLTGTLALAALAVVGCGGALRGGTAVDLHTATQTYVPPAVNAAYHEPLPPAYKAAFCGGPNTVIIRAAAATLAEAQAILDDLQPTRCLVDLLIEAPDVALCGAFGAVRGATYIEMGNELELPPFNLTPAQYGAFERTCAAALRAGGYTGALISGGVYTCTDDLYAYLRAAQLPPDITFYGLHCYNEDAEPQRLGKAFAVTEYGCPSNDPAGDAGCLAYGQAQLARFVGAAFAAYYQAASCAAAENLCHFGIVRVDGSTKPTLALVIR